MSWIDKINATVLTVVTGDGKVYKPLYKNQNNNIQEINMNATVLEFNDIEGALVLRGAVGAIGIPFEFIFQGEDHLDKRDEFIESAKDRNAWALSHPHIGTKTVQPIRLRYDNSGDNVTSISGELYETIQDLYPENKLSARKASEVKLQSSIDAGVLASNDLNLDASSINTATQVSGDVFNTLSGSAVSEFDLSSINEAIGKANSALSTIGTDPARYMTEFANVIRTPARYLDTISNRVAILAKSYEDLKESVQGSPNIGDKFWFEIAAAMNIVAIGEANLTPIEEIAEEQDVVLEAQDIVTRRQVITAINDMLALYDDYMDLLGSLQSDNDNSPTSYIPDNNNIIALQQAVSSVIANLLNIATSARQERIYTVKNDIPLVVLVHKLLGTTNDLIIQQFAKDNDMSRDEVLVVEAGREVTYYV